MKSAPQSTATTRGADIRIVKADGIIIRGHHHSLPPKARRKGERV